MSIRDRVQSGTGDEGWTIHTDGSLRYRGWVVVPQLTDLREEILREFQCSRFAVHSGGTDGTFEEGPVCIVDSRDQVLRRKTVRLVLVLWRHYGVEESTWEREDTMRATYPFLFRDEGTWFSRLGFK